MTTLQKFRAEYPLLETCIYADTAANGIFGNSLVKWRRQHDQNFLSGGSAMKLDEGNIFKQTKSTIAEIFGSSREQVSLVQNFSLGFNIILEGLSGREKVLLLEGEYPSVSWPFHSRNFTCVTIPIASALEEDIESAILKERIDVLAVSMVQYLNGIMLPPSFFKQLKAKFPELLIIVDATQYCGAYSLNFAESGIDIVGCSGYKWLLGGYGNGFFLFHPESWLKLQLKTTGFNAARGDLTMQGKFPQTMHLEPGHLDQLNFGSLNTSMKFLQEIGLKNIEAQNASLSRLLKIGLGDMGLLEPQVMDRPIHSTIYNIPFRDEVWNSMKENKVLCSLRGKGIRLSFHAYNTEEEVNELLGLLKILY